MDADQNFDYMFNFIIVGDSSNEIYIYIQVCRCWKIVPANAI